MNFAFLTTLVSRTERLQLSSVVMRLRIGILLRLSFQIEISEEEGILPVAGIFKTSVSTLD